MSLGEENRQFLVCETNLSMTLSFRTEFAPRNDRTGFSVATKYELIIRIEFTIV